MKTKRRCRAVGGRFVIGQRGHAAFAVVAAAIGVLAWLDGSHAAARWLREAALYPQDNRRIMTTQDWRRFTGAGILFCRDDDNVPHAAAASWLIGNRSLVMMNAHNFLDRNTLPTRGIEDCFFQIRGKNYEFDPKSIVFGVRHGATHMHITDDWALVRLRSPADVIPEPIPAPPHLETGPVTIKVTMVSPAGHGNFHGPSSIEACEIKLVDPPTEDGIRRVRHDCNDGFGGSGSGLFDGNGNLIAMQSASLDMNRRFPFDVEGHYGSALILEGELRAALLSAAATAGR